MNRAHGFILLILLAAGPVLAQSPVNRLEYQVPINPAVGGWNSPLTNLGGITFDFIPDRNRPIVSGQWIYQINGEYKSFFFQTNMVYSTQPEAIATGIISTFEGPTYDLTGRGDYADPVYGGGGTAVPTGRTIRLEFNTSRAGTFIDNPGKADERRFPIFASLRGAPLVAPTDYAGDWSVAVRVDGPQFHFQHMGLVQLRPFTGPTTFQVLDYSSVNNAPPAGVAVPQENARLYEVTCATADPENGLNACEVILNCGLLCESGVTRPLLWINPDEAGGFADSTRQASRTLFYDFGEPLLITYGDIDRIIIRGSRSATGQSITEMQFTRIPTGVFQ
ncbi:MAG: hypothetical protein WC000_04010 [Dokdonella sp.]